MKKTFEKIIRHEYEIDEEALKIKLVALNNKYHYDKDDFDAVEVFCDLCETDFEILVNGLIEPINLIDTYYDFDFYETIEQTLCDMIENFFLERKN